MTYSRKRSKVYIFLATLVGLIGFGALVQGQTQSDRSQFGSNWQDHQSVMRHQYVVDSSWNGCGFNPYEGWEGCMSQTGMVLRSDDGVKVYFVQEHCTSPNAAKNEELLRLTGTKEAASKWQISQQIALDDALLVELSSPVPVGLNESAASRWICLWVEKSSLVLIYGTDREHVVEYFRIHQQK